MTVNKLGKATVLESNKIFYLVAMKHVEILFNKSPAFKFLLSLSKTQKYWHQNILYKIFRVL